MRLGMNEALGALCAVAIACYAWPLFDPSRKWDFIYIWDDHENYLKNNVFRGLSWRHIHAMCTLTIVNVWEPFGWLLKAVVYAIAGLDSRAFRITTFIFHITTAAVLAKTASMIVAIAHIGNRMAGKTGTSSPEAPDRQHKIEAASYLPGCILSTLLLFVVHPINVEVVAWPSTLPYTLASFFSLLSIYFHCRQLQRKCLSRLSSQSPRAARGASPETETFPSEWDKLVATIAPSIHDRETQLSAAFFVAAVLSKSVCILLPVSAVLIDMLVAIPVALTIASQNSHFPSPVQSVCLVTQYLLSKMLHFTVAIMFVAVTLAANKEGANQNADALTLSPYERLVKALMTPAWTMHHVVWPTRLRPHYALHDDVLDLSTNPEYFLFVVASLVFLLWLASRESEFRAASFMAVAHFVSMSLPTCGIIQHGIVAQGADRYAYFPTMALVPIGGYYLTSWLELVDSHHQNPDAAAVATSAVPRSEGDRSRKVVRSQLHPQSRSASRKVVARTIYLIVLASMVHISNHQLQFWYDTKSFSKMSLRLEPADWRIIDLQYSYQQQWAGGCDETTNECNNWLNLMFHFSPSKSLKARLYRYMVLFVLGRQEYACEGYKMLLEEFPDSAMVHNNMAICMFHEEQFAEAREHIRLAHKLPHGSKHELKVIADNFFEVEQWMVDVARANGERRALKARLIW